MKKLLTILGAITLIGSSSVTVLACDPNEKTTPSEPKMEWSNEEILQRFGDLKIEELENGDFKLTSKNDQFKIWSGTDDGNKFERVIKKESYENNTINYLYDSLLPTNASYDNPFGVEMMSGFYVGKSEEEVNEVLNKGDKTDFIKAFASEMTNEMQWNLRQKNAFSIFLATSWTVDEVFNCSKAWTQTIKFETIGGNEVYVGLKSFYIDYFVAYVTSNLSSWVKEFFNVNKSQLESPELVIEEVVNDSDSIKSNLDNQHLNMKIKNATFDFLKKIIDPEDNEEKILYSLFLSFIASKASEHSQKYFNDINSYYKGYKFTTDHDENTVTHLNSGLKVWGPDGKKFDFNNFIYLKIDIV